MTVLVLSFMFPNDRDSSSGIFVLEQIKALRTAGVTVLVVSPTPWAATSFSTAARCQAKSPPATSCPSPAPSSTRTNTASYTGT